MAASKTSLRKSTNQPTRSSLMSSRSGTSIVWSTILLPTQLSPTVDLCGPARTMMGMFNQILLPKDMAPLASWRRCSRPPMVPSKPKLLTVLSLATTVFTRRAVKHQLTQSPPSSLGHVAFSTVPSSTTTKSLESGARLLSVLSLKALKTDKWPKTWPSAFTELTTFPELLTLTPSSSWTQLLPTWTRHWANESKIWSKKLFIAFETKKY